MNTTLSYRISLVGYCNQTGSSPFMTIKEARAFLLSYSNLMFRSTLCITMFLVTYMYVCVCMCVIMSEFMRACVHMGRY